MITQPAKPMNTTSIMNNTSGNTALRGLKLAVLAALLATTTTAARAAESLPQNGNFESWGAQEALPYSWYNSAGDNAKLLKGTIGTGNAAIFTRDSDTGISLLTTSQASSRLRRYNVSFDVAFAHVNANNVRLFQFTDFQNDDYKQAINIIISQESWSSNVLKIQAHNGSTWVDLGTIEDSGTFDSETKTYSALKIYTFSLSVDYDSSWKFTYGLKDGAQTSVAGLAFYQNSADTDTVLWSFNFHTINAIANGTAVALDNVSLTTVPEPAKSAAVLSILALALTACAVSRRR
ncbi:MAG: hypothetical protein LBK99_23985 [Opitutaceae bacterium]|jgi:hypothetical protein|nr:hypothetical protein [Opitutaceae bacterium]